MKKPETAGLLLHSIVMNFHIRFFGMNMGYRRTSQFMEIVSIHINICDRIFQLQAGISTTRGGTVIIEELSIGDVIESGG